MTSGGSNPLPGSRRDAAKRELKARMLCYGVTADSSTKAELVRRFNLSKGFIHGTVFLLDGHEPVNTAFVDELPLTRGEPIRIELTGARIWATLNDDWKFLCEPLAGPDALSAPLRGKLMGDYFSLHARRTLFSAPIRQCIFITVGKPCTFCTYEGGRIERLSRDEFESALGVIRAELPEISSVALGGGTPNLGDHGASYYAELARVAKDAGLSVSVEMVPPKDLDDLAKLYDAGVDSLIMSIELWDDVVRQRVCLGKGLISKQHYVDAWASAAATLGPGNVSSVLLVGIEHPRSTSAGVSALVDAGVIPTLIPFRRYDGIADPSLGTVDHETYLQLSEECGRLLRAANLDPRRQLGCTECGGCSLEIGSFLAAANAE